MNSLYYNISILDYYDTRTFKCSNGTSTSDVALGTLPARTLRSPRTSGAIHPVTAFNPPLTGTMHLGTIAISAVVASKAAALGGALASPVANLTGKAASHVSIHIGLARIPTIHSANAKRPGNTGAIQSPTSTTPKATRHATARTASSLAVNPKTPATRTQSYWNYSRCLQNHLYREAKIGQDDYPNPAAQSPKRIRLRQYSWIARQGSLHVNEARKLKLRLERLYQAFSPQIRRNARNHDGESKRPKLMRLHSDEAADSALHNRSGAPIPTNAAWKA